MDIDIYKRHWPNKKYVLYSMSDDPGAIHLHRAVGDDISILMRVEWKKNKVTVLALEIHDSEEAAVVWYVEEKQKRDAH